MIDKRDWRLVEHMNRWLHPLTAAVQTLAINVQEGGVLYGIFGLHFWVVRSRDIFTYSLLSIFIIFILPQKLGNYLKILFFKVVSSTLFVEK